MSAEQAQREQQTKEQNQQRKLNKVYEMTIHSNN